MRPSPLAALALLALVLSGCAGGLEDADPPADTSDDQAPTESVAPGEPLDAALPFTVTGAAVPAMYAIATGDQPAGFTVPGGAAVLTVHMEWTCATAPLCDLDLSLGDGKALHQLSGSSPMTMEVPMPRPGKWSVALFPAREGSVPVEAEGTLRVTTT